MGKTQDPFSGFGANEPTCQLPEVIFQHLGAFTELGQTKICLYFLWRQSHADDKLVTLRRNDLLLDLDLMSNFGQPEELDNALLLAVQSGFILAYDDGTGNPAYCVNTPQGKEFIRAVAEGREMISVSPASINKRPNIYELYEQNFGLLTPMVGQILAGLEAEYPPGWIVDAMAVGVKMNKKNLKYIEAILKRWKEEGRGEKPVRPDPEKSSAGDESRRKLEQFLGNRKHK